MLIVACPVTVKLPDTTRPVVPVLLTFSGTMMPATSFTPPGPWMCAAVTGPLRLPDTSTEYEIVVTEPEVDAVNVAVPVALVVTAVGFSAPPVSVALNVLVSGGPLGSSSSSSQATASVDRARSAVSAKRTFISNLRVRTGQLRRWYASTGAGGVRIRITPQG